MSLGGANNLNPAPEQQRDAATALQWCLRNVLRGTEPNPQVDLMLASGGCFSGSLESMQDGCVDLLTAGMWYRIRIDQIIGVGWPTGEPSRARGGPR